MTEKQQEVWDRAVETLFDMCMQEKLKRGPAKGAFILTLEIYAREMRKLLDESGDVATPSKSGQTMDLAGVLGASITGLHVEDVSHGVTELRVRLQKEPKKPN